VRILGIDLGEKKIGLAVSDPLFFTSQPLGFYLPQSREKDLSYFRNLVKEYEIGEIVVGFPLQMNGQEGIEAGKARSFAGWLEESLGLPVILWDERLTTKQALRILRHQEVKARKKKAYKDQISASLILSCYLESKRAKKNDPEDR
jgi:putative Holliday junction resolvase